MQNNKNYLIIDKTNCIEPYYRDIANIYLNNGWGSQYLNSTIQKMFKGCYYLIALEGKRAVGLIRAFTDEISVTHLSEIIVAPALQGQGVGKALMEVLIKELGHTTIYADVLGNPPAALLKKFGLQEKPKLMVYARRGTSQAEHR